MKTRVASLLVATAWSSIAITGCGGDDGGRPTAGEVSEAFTAQFPMAPAAVADCLGERLEASELPDRVLRDLMGGDDDVDDEYTKTVADITDECAGELAEGG